MIARLSVDGELLHEGDVEVCPDVPMCVEPEVRP